MSVSLDLRKAWRHQRHGDLVVVMTWVNDARALVLMPALRRDAGWYIVDESAAYLWGVDSDDPLIRLGAQEHAMKQSHVACSMLGIEPNRPNRARIISIITGWLPDLIRMPSAPDPELQAASYGSMVLNADGVPIAGEDLREEVKGVEYEVAAAVH